MWTSNVRFGVAAVHTLCSPIRLTDRVYPQAGDPRPMTARKFTTPLGEFETPTPMVLSAALAPVSHLVPGTGALVSQLAVPLELGPDNELWVGASLHQNGMGIAADIR